MRDCSNISAGFSDFAENALKSSQSGREVTPPLTPVRMCGYILEADIKNNSGSDATVGWGYKLLDADWKAGQWDDSETGVELTDDTTDAQNTASGTFPLTTTTNNDGAVFQFSERGEAIVIGMSVSSTVATGSPVYEWSYWDGSAWQTIVPLVSPTLTAEAKTAAVVVLPSDAAKGYDDADMYAVRVRATTAPSQAPVLSYLWISILLDHIGTLASGSSLSAAKGGLSGGKKIPPGHSVVAYSSVSDTRNSVDIDFIYGF